MEELNNQTTATATFYVPAGKIAHVYQAGTMQVFVGKQYAHLKLAPGEGVFITLQ